MLVAVVGGVFVRPGVGMSMAHGAVLVQVALDELIGCGGHRLLG
jgi:hypothetical protein